VAEPSELNLWTRQWRDGLIKKARADYRNYDAAWFSLNDKNTDYARSIKMARDVCAQVLAVWESSPVDLPEDEDGVAPSDAARAARTELHDAISKADHALWVMLEHSTLHHGDKHSNVTLAREALNALRTAVRNAGVEASDGKVPRTPESKP
jgi:hypothetical protein